jgi:hypothetical protein
MWYLILFIIVVVVGLYLARDRSGQPRDELEEYDNWGGQ